MTFPFTYKSHTCIGIHAHQELEYHVGWAYRLAIEQMWSLGFAGDMSGLAWDRRRQAFWIVSDRDRSVYLWNLASGLMGWSALVEKKTEGVAYDPDTDRLHTVRETKSRPTTYEPGQVD